MILKIRIRTPKGHATKLSKKLQPYILGLTQSPKTVQVNKADDQLIWTYEGDTRRCSKIMRNVMVFDKLITMTLDAPLMKKFVRKHLSDDGEKELQQMLLKQTTVDIIKE